MNPKYSQNVSMMLMRNAGFRYSAICMSHVYCSLPRYMAYRLLKNSAKKLMSSIVMK